MPTIGTGQATGFCRWCKERIAGVLIRPGTIIGTDHKIHWLGWPHQHGKKKKPQLKAA